MWAHFFRSNVCIQIRKRSTTRKFRATFHTVAEKQTMASWSSFEFRLWVEACHFTSDAHRVHLKSKSSFVHINRTEWRNQDDEEEVNACMYRIKVNLQLIRFTKQIPVWECEMNQFPWILCAHDFQFLYAKPTFAFKDVHYKIRGQREREEQGGEWSISGAVGKLCIMDEFKDDFELILSPVSFWLWMILILVVPGGHPLIFACSHKHTNFVFELHLRLLSLSQVKRTMQRTSGG